MAINIENNIYFKNQNEASKRLIETLPIELLSHHDTVVLGVTENGVYLAQQIAKAIDAKLDILLTEAIIAPNNHKLAIAMVSETEDVVIHKALINSFGINEDYIYNEANRKYDEEILNYVYKYRKGKEMTSLQGKYVVLVADAIETGLTMMVALKSVIAKEAKYIYIAVPIVDKLIYQNLVTVSDGVFCTHIVQDYISIEYYYENIEPFTFDDIVSALENNN
ncbi:MAG: phosphoribosyltransferase family protein [Sulfurovum sp.]